MAARGLCPAAMDRGSLQTKQAAELLPRNDRRLARVSPGAVRRKASSQDLQFAVKVWKRPGIRLERWGSWCRDGGDQEVLSETRRAGVACIPSHAASHGRARPWRGPNEGREPRGEMTRREPPKGAGKAKDTRRHLVLGAWRWREGGQGALSCRKGQGLRAYRARRRATAAKEL